MKSPEQLAEALKQINDLCLENDMPAIFVGTVKANDDIKIITYPGHDTKSDQGIDAVAQQLYLAAVRTPKSHLTTIILNVAAAMCVSSPVIEQTFYADLAKKRGNETMSTLEQRAIEFASAK